MRIDIKPVRDYIDGLAGDVVARADAFILGKFGLEHIPPGGSTLIQVQVQGTLAMGLGVKPGTTAAVSIERNLDTPRQYTFKVGGGASLDGVVSASTAGAGAELSVGLGCNVGLELTADMSQPGAPIELAAFACHTGLLAAMPLPVSQALLAAEQIPGFELPGEPITYIQEHLTALEISGNVHVSGEMGLVLGLGLTGELLGSLAGGGRIERNLETGTVTLHRRLELGGAGALAEGGGAGGAGLNLTLSGASGSLHIQERFQLRPEEGARTYVAELKVEGSRGGKGYRATFSFDVTGLPGEGLRGQVLGALAAGEPGQAQRLLQEAIHTMSIPGRLRVEELSTSATSMGVAPAAGGITAGVKVALSQARAELRFSGEVSLTLQAFSSGGFLEWVERGGSP